MKMLYIIAGCNGAGKTTASYTILPDILHCKEFVNADEIAKGISPFQPEKVSFEAGRLMLTRIHKLLETGETFAFETTLSTRSYVHLIEKAKEQGYLVTLVFFWLDAVELAISRVENRVKEGGHHIPEDIIRRRYTRGLKNFFNLYLEIVDNWIFVDNSGEKYEIVAKNSNSTKDIYNNTIWNNLEKLYNGK